MDKLEFILTYIEEHPFTAALACVGGAVGFIVDTVIKNGNYKDYNYVLEDVSRNITQAGKTLQGLVNEIYSNIK